MARDINHFASQSPNSQQIERERARGKARENARHKMTNCRGSHEGEHKTCNMIILPLLYIYICVLRLAAEHEWR